MQPKALDLFAGCGGLSLGLENAGFEIAVANELDHWAAQTYEANHQRVRMVRADIRGVRRSVWKELAGEIDLVAGGPPCQGFSVTGRRQYGEVPEQNTLVESFLGVVSLVKPRLVLLENVAGFRTAQLRPGVKALPFTLRRLEEMGYFARAELLQAADFGVPSLRSRLVVVGSRAPWPKQIFNPSHSDQNERLPRYLGCMDAISDLPVIEAGEGVEEIAPYGCAPQNGYQREIRTGSRGVRNHVAMRHTAKLVERFAKIAPGMSSYHLDGDVTVYKSNNQRLIASVPSLCVTANFQSNYVHPMLNRNLTAREAARLMSYPDTFIFQGKRTLMSRKFLEKYGRSDEAGLSQYNQIGNSVPPILARAIGAALMRQLNSSDRDETRAA